MNDLLTELKCSYDASIDHFVEEPVSLDCGHCVCKSCIPRENPCDIECQKCGRISVRHLNNAKECTLAKSMMELYLSIFYKEVEDEMAKHCDLFKNLVETKNEAIELQFQFVHEEIELRIESMKNELDKIRLKFESDLRKLKEKLQKQQNALNDDMKIDSFENNLHKLREEMKNENEISERKFYNHQNMLKALKRSVRSIESNFDSFHLQFKPGNSVDEESVGKLDFLEGNINEETGKAVRDVAEIIEKGEYDVVSSIVCYTDCIMLSSGRYILSGGELKLYDHDFKNSVMIGEKGKFLALNKQSKEFYAMNIYFNSISKFDYNLKRLKCVNFEKTCIAKDISCSDSYVYVCDSVNQRIHIFTHDLKHVEAIPLEYSPFNIKVTTKSIGVNGNKGLFFYDFNMKKKKRHYSRAYGRINVVDDKFYVMSHSPKLVLHEFNIDGDLTKEIHVEWLNNFISTTLDGTIIRTSDSSLVVLSNSRKAILRFEI